EVEPLVGEGDLVVVGRPHGIVIERRRWPQTVLLGFAVSIRRAHAELILSTLVGEVGNGFPIWGPCGISFGGTSSIGQVANVAFFTGYGENFSVRLKDGASAGGRQVGRGNLFLALDEMRPHLRQVGIDLNVEGVFPAGSEI